MIMSGVIDESDLLLNGINFFQIYSQTTPKENNIDDDFRESYINSKNSMQ